MIPESSALCVNDISVNCGDCDAHGTTGGYIRADSKTFHAQSEPFVVRPEANFSYVHNDAGRVIVLYVVSYVHSSPNHLRFAMDAALATRR
jgi:hypothetical protein